jgi:hypothetical protein
MNDQSKKPGFMKRYKLQGDYDKEENMKRKKLKPLILIILLVGLMVLLFVPKKMDALFLVGRGSQQGDIFICTCPLPFSNCGCNFIFPIE